MRVALVGAPPALRGPIASAIALHHDVMVVSPRPRAGSQSCEEVSWRASDPYSLSDTDAALRGMDVAVYLGRGDAPEPRLTQGSEADLDLLCADNAARAAESAGLRLSVVGAWTPTPDDTGAIGWHECLGDEVVRAFRARSIALAPLPSDALAAWLGIDAAQPPDIAALVCLVLFHAARARDAHVAWDIHTMLATPGAEAAALLAREAAHRAPTQGAREALPLEAASSRADEARHVGAVRSVQRLRLPPGRDARWLAEEYLAWLPGSVGSIVRVVASESGTRCLSLAMTGRPLLELRLDPDQSGTDRQIYRVVGGLLAKTTGPVRPRLEFRTVLGGGVGLAVLHDFEPRLPWLVYRATQAPLHALVMARFADHLAGMAPALPIRP